VAMLLSQSAPLIAAIFGVLKSGKIYVPVDPRPPASQNYLPVGFAGGLADYRQRASSLARQLVGGHTPC
jgi:acyl-CoA synthetase (AMP-forming)/AMP-acid ligase II